MADLCLEFSEMYKQIIRVMSYIGRWRFIRLLIKEVQHGGQILPSNFIGVS